MIDIAILAAIFALLLLFTGCAEIKYGDLTYRRWFNQKIDKVEFNEYVEDANGFSDVTITIEGQESENGQIVRAAVEGAVKGLNPLNQQR